MGTITIVDTGWISSDCSGTRIGTSDRANSGSTITLRVTEINTDRGAGLDNVPNPGVYGEDTDVNFVSQANRIFRVSFVLNRLTAADITLGYQIERLLETEGLKILYHSDSSDPRENVITMLGNKNTAGTDDHFLNGGPFLTSGHEHLHIRVKSLAWRDTDNTKIIKGTLILEEAK